MLDGRAVGAACRPAPTTRFRPPRSTARRSLRVRAAGLRAGAQRGHDPPRAPDAETAARRRARPDLQQPHPLDPDLSGAVAISRRPRMLNVTRGQLVPYVITVNNVAACRSPMRPSGPLPGGFTYVEGSARLDGVPTEPTVAGRELIWGGSPLPARRSTRCSCCSRSAPASPRRVRKPRAGGPRRDGQRNVRRGDGDVRVVPDPTVRLHDVTGKVFDDANRNGMQDGGEAGLAACEW